MGHQKLMVNLEIKVYFFSPKLPEVFGVRELYQIRLLLSPESDEMPRWQDTEASLVEGFIWFAMNALAISPRYLVQSIYHTTL